MAKKGKSFSEEHKKALSDSRKNMKLSETHKNNIKKSSLKNVEEKFKDKLPIISKIKEELNKGQKKISQLAKEFSIDETSVMRISRNRIFSSVEPKIREVSIEVKEVLIQESKILKRKKLIEKYPDIPIGFINQLYYKIKK